MQNDFILSRVQFIRIPNQAPINKHAPSEMRHSWQLYATRGFVIERSEGLGRSNGLLGYNHQQRSHHLRYNPFSSNVNNRYFKKHCDQCKYQCYTSINITFDHSQSLTCYTPDNNLAAKSSRDSSGYTSSDIPYCWGVIIRPLIDHCIRILFAKEAKTTAM